MKWVSEQVASSPATIAKHYWRYIESEQDVELRAFMDRETGIPTEISKEVNDKPLEVKGKTWRPRRDLNPIKLILPKARKSLMCLIFQS